MTTFVAKNPDFDRDVRENISNMPVTGLIGLEVLSLEPGRSEVCLPYREELCQTTGFIQAGVIGMLADIAGGAAAGTLLAKGWLLMTVDYSVKLIAPAVGDRIIARGEVTRGGGTLTVSRVDVLAEARGRERLCAVGLVTLLNRDTAAAGS